MSFSIGIGLRALLRSIPAELWAGLLLLAAFGFALWWSYDTGHDRAKAKAATEIAALRAEIENLESANASAKQVVEQLANANRDLAEGRAADQEAAADAVAKLAGERDALARDLERRRGQRETIYEADQSAAAWAAARVPDAVARSLRE